MRGVFGFNDKCIRWGKCRCKKWRNRFIAKQLDLFALLDFWDFAEYFFSILHFCRTHEATFTPNKWKCLLPQQAPLHGEWREWMTYKLNYTIVTVTIYAAIKAECAANCMLLERQHTGEATASLNEKNLGCFLSCNYWGQMQWHRKPWLLITEVI